MTRTEAINRWKDIVETVFWAAPGQPKMPHSVIILNFAIRQIMNVFVIVREFDCRYITSSSP